MGRRLTQGYSGPKNPFLQAFDSSVGRAWDCKGYMPSRGRWFEPGSKDSFSLPQPGAILIVIAITDQTGSTTKKPL